MLAPLFRWWFAVMVVATLAACTVGVSGDAPGFDACAAQSDYAACRTDDRKDGWCVPDAGCVEACAEITDACWNFTYAWPHDPERLQRPICWCTDDSSPSQSGSTAP